MQKKADEAVHAACSDNSDEATHSINSDSAKHAECADKAVRACHAECSDKAEFADKSRHAEKADCAEKTEFSKVAEYAKKAKFAKHADVADSVNGIDTTKFFWIMGNPNSTQISSNAKLVVQNLPVNVEVGESININHIRCSLGYYSPPHCLVLEVYAAQLRSTTPLSAIVTSTDCNVDEVPISQTIYTNNSSTKTTVLIQVVIANKTADILHTDMPDSWWIGVSIK